MDIVVTEADFDLAVEYQRLCQSAPHAGAVVVFVGLVRDLVSDEASSKVDYIEIQHYPGMTERLCQEIVVEAQQRYPCDAVRIIHRVGKLYANEQIVMVAVASRHRENAFHAAQFIMDYLKTRATFWKKEVGDHGEQWLGLRERDTRAAKRWNDNSSNQKHYDE